MQVATTQSNKNNAQQQGRAVLVVEDDDGIREMLQMSLEIEGYTVFAARNGRHALTLLAQIPKPCLILLDLMMPEMNGWEFVAVVEKDAELSNIPIVVVTAYGDQASTIKVNGLIRKPIDLDLLIRVVQEWCGCPGGKGNEQVSF